MNIPQATKTPLFILMTEGQIHGEDTAENRELVRRIEVCVAACAGISTEELERGIVQDMQRTLADVVPLLQARVQKSDGASIPARVPLVIHNASVSRRAV